MIGLVGPQTDPLLSVLSCESTVFNSEEYTEPIRRYLPQKDFFGSLISQRFKKNSAELEAS